MPTTRKPYHARGPDTAAAVWKEQDSLHGKIVETGVIILRTAGCSHYHKSGCSMCGFNYESDGSVGPENIKMQFDAAMRDLGEPRFVKVYTSGSFLDECEISREVAKHILRTTADRGSRLLFESRPEFVTENRLAEALAVNQNIEIALGLESSNDMILKYSVNKGFTKADYEIAADNIQRAGIDLRTYVLLKPPFLTESESISDSIETINYASAFSRTISLNPVNVQKGTLVERLWRNWAYRPPWLWSVLEVLRATKANERRVICDPTGGGKERGAHNCGLCDETILASVRSFSASQEIGKLGYPECECRDIWKSILELDGFVMGGTADLKRFFRPRK